MVRPKTEEEIALMRETGILVSKTLAEVGKIVAPGVTTLELNRVAETFIRDNGAIPSFLGFIAILPAFAMLCGVNNQFASFYGGTSLLILVGVVLDTLQQIESHLLMRHYDGLMKTGRLKGRSGL